MIFSRWFVVVGLVFAGLGSLHAGVMQYEVAGPSSIREFNLEEHFRPSSVYKFVPDSRWDLIDSTGNVVHLSDYPTAWNQAGDIVGKSFWGANENIGYLYRNGEITYFEPKQGIISQGAYAINNLGQAVGGAHPMAGNAYLYSNGVKTDLGRLGGRLWNNASDINDAGVIVGQSESNVLDRRAFVVQGGTMFDLNEITSNIAKGFTIDSALAITSDGWILVHSTDFTKVSPYGGTYWSDVPQEELWLKPSASDNVSTSTATDSSSTTTSTSTVIDTTSGGFWTTPTNTPSLNGPATNTGGGSVVAPQPAPVPEPATYLIWGLLGIFLIWKRLA